MKQFSLATVVALLPAISPAQAMYQECIVKQDGEAYNRPDGRSFFPLPKIHTCTSKMVTRIGSSFKSFGTWSTMVG